MAAAQPAEAHPWPMYGQNSRGNCRTVDHASHILPELRWWAPLGPELMPHFGGPAIGWFHDDNTPNTPPNRYIVVGLPIADAGGTHLYVFRFRPASPDYSSIDPTAPVLDIPIGDQVLSTPLILENGRVIVRTRSALVCVWPFPPMGQSTFCWSMPLPLPLPAIDSGTGSAKAALLAPLSTQDRQERVYVWAGGKMTCVDPNLDPNVNGIIWSYQTLASGNNTTTPAIGPSAEDPSRLLVYATSWSSTGAPPIGECETSKNFHVFFADGNNGNALAWEARINRSCQFTQIGSIGSPAVHDAPGQPFHNQVVVGSDDGQVYAFLNASAIVDPVNEPDNYRWHESASYYVSSTPALTSNGDIFCWREGYSNADMRRFSEFPDALNHHFRAAAAPFGWVGGAPTLDAYGRVIFASGHYKARRVYAYDLHNSGLLPIWGLHFEYPESVDIMSNAPSAIDYDGSLVVVNNGYIVVAGIPECQIGDFDGDRIVSNFDVDPLVLALIDPPAWEAAVGTPLGINVVGIGDCNHDGRFNNFDIECLVDRILHPLTCEGSLGMLSGSSAGAFGESAPTAEYVCEAAAYLYTYFGMQPPAEDPCGTAGGGE